jgi:subtilisin-like proprotein convertase family protein
MLSLTLLNLTLKFLIGVYKVSNFIKYITSLVIATMLLTGCGGSSSSDTTSSSITLSGVAVDGYIRGATVCLDENINGICDAKERIVLTDSIGKLSFTGVSNTLSSLILSGGTDTAIDKQFSGNLKKILNIDLSKSLNSFVLTPLSDVVASYFLSQPSKTSDKLNEICKNIATTFGLTVDELLKDPMMDSNIFKKSQEIQQIKILMRETGVNENDISLSIAGEIVDAGSSDINISSIYNRFTNNVATDKISYIQNYIDSLKISMNDNISDNVLLAKYQMLIDDTTYQVSKRLADNNISLQVPIDLSYARVSSSIPIVQNLIADITIDINSTTQTIDLTNVFTDVDDDSNITKIVLSNSNEALVTTSLSENTLILNFRPTQGDLAIITIRATSNGLSVNDNFEVVVNNDFDNDFIPNDVEDFLGMEKNNSDENNNGIIDGLDSSIELISDQFFDKQWYIRSLGTQVNPYSASQTIEGNDLDIMDIYHRYMGYNNGDPLVVQVVDTGVDANHEDLVQNMDLGLSRNSETNTTGDPAETGLHGTMCAGIIGARAFNGKGVRGIAPFVKIAGSNWLGYQSVSELEEVWTKNDPDAKIILASNSWGTESASPSTFYEDLMAYGANNLRKVDGIVKGKLFLKAAGNGRGNNHDSGLSYSSSNPYVITVAALKNDNTYASYSSSGSNIFVSGYSGNYYNDSATIATTNVTGRSALVSDLTYNSSKDCYVRSSDNQCSEPTWDEDNNFNYTYAMNGTSAATPLVAGSLALVLEACPELTWRDVKYLIAKNAIQIDSANSSWQTNGAKLHHSVDYGFGLINPKGMIEECRGGYISLPNSTTFIESFDPSDIAIPDNDTTGISYIFTVSNNKTIEWLGVTVYSDHSYAGDLEIYLTSPSGTKTRLMLGANSGGSYSLLTGFRYGSVAFMGESSIGDWTLDIADIFQDDNGSLQKIDFEVFGH